MIKLIKMFRLKIMLQFRSCIPKINSMLINNAEDLDIVMSMYDLLEYSQNYSMISGRLWNYYRDKINDVDDNASDDKSFKYKTKTAGKTPERPPRPPRSPQSWTKDCILTEHLNNITGAKFQINNAKIFVPVVILSLNNNIKFLENIKQRFKRTIYWNKNRPEATAQPKNNNLDYLIDPTFRNINRLFFHLKRVTIILRDILLISITCH